MKVSKRALRYLLLREAKVSLKKVNRDTFKQKLLNEAVGDVIAFDLTNGGKGINSPYTGGRYGRIFGTKNSSTLVNWKEAGGSARAREVQLFRKVEVTKGAKG